MSAPHFAGMGPPPLPPGWTEHVSPTGQPYYHNVQTQESTYVRPLPTFPVFPPGAVPPGVNHGQQKKKEKPFSKTPIPGTPWIRVRTTEGNVFYTHTAEKRSVWTVPEEIAEVVEEMDREAQGKKAAEDEKARQKESERAVEVQRIKAEMKDGGVKRKAVEAVPMDEVVISKKARTDDEEEDDDDESEEESEEEDWQREAAAQLAAEAEEERKRQEEEKKRQEEEVERAKEEEKKGLPRLNMPDRVDLSIDEAKALFKALLREKDINPLQPWDMALPLFISDPRYVLLPSVSARKEAFDEYCRDRARELRQSQVKKDKAEANPKEEYEKLLHEEVKSTRTSWTDWRRQWKKDRRFYGWGRDDREREKRFREYLKELGEKKRAAAQKAETDFFVLLKESGIGKPEAVWKDVKHKISNDPRYDAVGSSSLREELFNTFLKARGESPQLRDNARPEATLEAGEKYEETEEERERRRREKKEIAVKQREEQVRAERSKLDADISRSKSGLNKEENELEYRTLLVDAIREPQVTWEGALPQLQTDPRFTHSSLSHNHQLHLFHAHVGSLHAKHLANLHALFISHARSLATPFTELPVADILSSLPATKLGLDIHKLEGEYEKWQRDRNREARTAFDQMLGENSFIEFWGRLGKIGGKGVDETIKADDLGDDEEEEQVDMKALAKNVDLKEVVRVLENDARYLAFDHVQEQREKWLRDYMSNLSAPKLSVHVP